MKFVCPVCGYVEEFDGDELPEGFKCPQCGVDGSRFIKQDETEMTWAAEHVIGVGKLPEVSEDIVNDLRANFEGECTEVGMYLAMARVAHREGYQEEPRDARRGRERSHRRQDRPRQARQGRRPGRHP